MTFQTYLTEVQFMLMYIIYLIAFFIHDLMNLSAKIGFQSIFVRSVSEKCSFLSSFYLSRYLVSIICTVKLRNHVLSSGYLVCLFVCLFDLDFDFFCLFLNSHVNTISHFVNYNYFLLDCLYCSIFILSLLFCRKRHHSNYFYCNLYPNHITAYILVLSSSMLSTRQ